MDLNLVLISVIFVAFSILLSHYMNDHDRTRIKFLYIRGEYISKYKDHNSLKKYIEKLLHNDNSNNSKNEKENLLDKIRVDYLKLRISLCHFGYIDLTLQILFFSLILLLMYLNSQLIKTVFNGCNGWNIKFVPLVVAGLTMLVVLVAQHWIYIRQSLSCVRKVKEIIDNDLESCLRLVLKEEIKGKITPVISSRDQSYQWTEWRMEWKRFSELKEINYDRVWFIIIYSLIFIFITLWSFDYHFISAISIILIIMKVIYVDLKLNCEKFKSILLKQKLSSIFNYKSFW